MASSAEGNAPQARKRVKDSPERLAAIVAAIELQEEKDTFAFFITKEGDCLILAGPHGMRGICWCQPEVDDVWPGLPGRAHLWHGTLPN